MSAYGAIDSETHEYVLPSNAVKGKIYECGDCNQRVIFRSGEVRAPHFAHFNPGTKCTFYNTSSGESDSHKHAKLLLKKWLIQKKPITFIWSCKHPTIFGDRTCGTMDGYTDETIEYKDGDEVVLEYRSPDGKYVADIAVLNGGAIRYIIEVKHSHSTTTDCRPEPWFEVNANEIDEAQHYQEKVIGLENCRINEKRYCANCRVKKEKWVTGIPILKKKYGKERLWVQDADCLVCGREQYSPEWIGGHPRQVCKICLGCEPEKVRQIVNNLIWS